MLGSFPTLVRYHYHLTTASRLAVDSIRAHKMRSFLTLLGVIIGVASVVLVGAAIEGLGPMPSKAPPRFSAATAT